MRLIDADKLKEYINSLSAHLLCEWDTAGVLMAIDKQPTKNIPEKKSEFSAQNDYLLYSAKGWNACIDAILNEGGDNA